MEPTLRAIPTADWMTVLIFGSIVFMVVAKGLFYTRFLNFIILPFNNKYIFMYNKKEKLLNWFHIFFTIFMISNFSLFIFLSWRAFFQPEYTSYPFIFPIILGALLFFLLTKIFLQLGNGFIFGSNKIISDLVFKKLTYLNHSGIVMLLANIILCYIARDSKVVIYIATFLILLINGIGWVTTVKNHQKFITNNFFYFILYLCALEIAPFIIIASYLTD